MTGDEREITRQRDLRGVPPPLFTFKIESRIKNLNSSKALSHDGLLAPSGALFISVQFHRFQYHKSCFYSIALLTFQAEPEEKNLYVGAYPRLQDVLLFNSPRLLSLQTMPQHIVLLHFHPTSKSIQISSKSTSRGERNIA